MKIEMMKAFFVLFVFCTALFPFAKSQGTVGCEDLFLSEYRDGPGNDDLVEVYNPSDASKNLDGYELRLYRDGSAMASTINLNGTIAPKGTYVLSHPSASPNLQVLADTASSALEFDGNDAIELARQSVSLDIIGKIGSDPGSSGWTVWAQNSTTGSSLNRKYTVTKGELDWAIAADQWRMFQPDSLLLASSHENICVCEFSNAPVMKWFVRGMPEEFKMQSDVYLFRLINNQKYAGILPPAVDSISFVSAGGHDLNFAYFNSASSAMDRDAFKAQIRNDSLFQFETKAVTVFDTLDYVNEKYLWASDLINVVFNDPSPSPAVIQKISSDYGLTATHTPDPNLPVGGNSSWTYQFRINQNGCSAKDVFKTSFEMIANDSLDLKTAEPWLEPIAESQFGVSTTDPYYDRQWHIKNTGQCLLSSGGNGTLDGDSDIEEAWAYATGNNIKVAVIDKGVYDMNHPDISSQYVNGFDFIDNDADITTCSGTVSGHGQACAGLIAAKANNNLGAVGVAYDAKIYPYITWLGSASLAFQRATLEGVHVISCSWGWYGNFNTAIEADILNARTLGRGGKGILTLAAAGNDGNNNGTLATKVFPASLSSVVGVVASDPDDKLKTFPKWGLWESNYGEGFNVAAPGTHMVSTDLMGIAGYNLSLNPCGNPLPNDYTEFAGTSAAAPVAAGVCALIFESDTNYTANDVQALLESTAEKVGGYVYDANGYSVEFGYGRVNAFNALPVSRQQPESASHSISIDIIPNPLSENGQLRVETQRQTTITVELLDALGRNKGVVATNAQVAIGKSYFFDLPVSDLLPGIYLVVLHAKDGSSMVKKLIIQK